jgi:hypothetical protein
MVKGRIASKFFSQFKIPFKKQTISLAVFRGSFINDVLGDFVKKTQSFSNKAIGEVVKIAQKT